MIKRGIMFFVLLICGITPVCGEGMSRVIEYGYRIENTRNSNLTNVEFWTYGPVDQHIIQNVKRMTTEPISDLTVDQDGNQVLHFTIPNLAPFASKIIRIRAEMEFSVNPRSVKIDRLDRVLQPDSYIESNAEDICGVAITLGGTSSVEIARCAYAWILKHIKNAGKYYAQDLGAEWALKHREGDCTELSYLFVALCRARDIPARVMGGFPCNGNAILSASTYHNWAEFYDGSCWQLVDCQLGNFMQSAQQYVAMRVFAWDSPVAGFHRFAVEGNGVKVSMMK